jgi:hypothetical protein
MQLRDLDVSHAVVTSAGLFGIWRTSAFEHVSELDQWEDEVAEELKTQPSCGRSRLVLSCPSTLAGTAPSKSRCVVWTLQGI